MFVRGNDLRKADGSGGVDFAQSVFHRTLEDKGQNRAVFFDRIRGIGLRHVVGVFLDMEWEDGFKCHLPKMWDQPFLDWSQVGATVGVALHVWFLIELQALDRPGLE